MADPPLDPDKPSTDPNLTGTEKIQGLEASHESSSGSASDLETPESTNMVSLEASPAGSNSRNSIGFPSPAEQSSELMIEVKRGPRKKTTYNPEHMVPLAALIRELTHPQNGKFPKGITPKELNAYVQSMPEQERPSKSKNHLQVMLWRDVNSGTIARVKLGHYAAPEFVAEISSHAKRTPKSPGKSGARPVRTIKPTVPFGITDNKPARTSPRQRRKPESTTTELQSGVSPVNGEKSGKSVVADSVMIPPEKPAVKRKRLARNTLNTGSPPAGKKARTAICDYCLLQKRKNEYGKWEYLLICSECSAKAHPTCMGYVPEQGAKCFRAPTWQCIDCKTCSVCKLIDATKDVIFCESCEKGYHFRCHEPEIQQKPTGSWYCKNCENNSEASILASLREDALAIIRTSQCLSGVSAPVPVAKGAPEGGTSRPASSPHFPCSSARNSPTAKVEVNEESSIMLFNGSVNILLPKHESQDNLCAVLLRKPSSVVEKLQANALNELQESQMVDYLTIGHSGVYDKAVMVAQDWSVADVAKFISDLSFPSLANVFLEQEIDGSSLLLLRRSDILQLLGLKLGPALKLYHRIVKLQNLVSLKMKQEKSLDSPPIIFDDTVCPTSPVADKCHSPSVGNDTAVDTLTIDDEDDFIDEMPKLELNSPDHKTSSTFQPTTAQENNVSAKCSQNERTVTPDVLSTDSSTLTQQTN